MLTHFMYQEEHRIRRHHHPLVGRTSEYEQMLHLLQVVETHFLPLHQETFSASYPLPDCPPMRQQTTQCLLLVGEAGIGKTRLAEEYSLMAKQRDWLVFWGQGSEQVSQTPYALWHSLLSTALSLDISYPCQVSSILAPLLENHQYHLSHATTTRKEPSPFQVWEAASTLFICLAARAPLLIILDDLKWCDSLSRDLLVYLARAIGNFPILLVATLRSLDQQDSVDSAFQRGLADLIRDDCVKITPVQSLDAHSLDQLVDILGKQLSYEQRITIREQSAGNPFFCEKLIHYVLSRRKKRRGVIGSFLPLPLATLLDQHIASVGGTCQQLLEQAAVLGGSFSLPMITRLSDIPTLRTEMHVLDALDEAFEAGIITEVVLQPRTFTEQILYQFWHPLLASRIYERIPNSKRIQLHQRVALVLSERYSEQEEKKASEILSHLLRGNAHSSQIVHYAKISAKHAYHFFAYSEAEHYFRLILDHKKLDPSKGSISAEQSLLWDLLGECAMVQGRYQDAASCYQQALFETYQCQGISLPDAHLAEYRALLCRERGLAFRYLGENDQAWACYHEGVRVLKEARIDGGPSWASLQYLSGCLHWEEGHVDQALSAVEEALLLFRQSLPKEEVSTLLAADQTKASGYISERYLIPFSRCWRTLLGDPVDVGRTQMFLAILVVIAGEGQDALAHLTDAVTIFERHSCYREAMIACNNIGNLLLQRARYIQAKEYFQRAYSLAERIGSAASLSVSIGNLGLLAMRCGDLREGETHLKKSLHIAEQIRDPVYISLWSSSLALILQKQGDREGAWKHLRHAYLVGRSIPAIFGNVLIMFARMLLTYIQSSSEQHLLPENKVDQCIRYQRLLYRAILIIERALHLPGLEMETKVEGLHVRASANFLQGHTEKAEKLAIQVHEEAQRYNLAWLLAENSQLLARIKGEQKSTVQPSLTDHSAQHMEG